MMAYLVPVLDMLPILVVGILFGLWLRSIGK